ncbi:MAG: hypothetical protein KF886_02040 [Candidatus Hydrogenedentes bacterium]|nr:hypothetical protein [Candidatus Hydrogenedentota bacterium]
MLLIKQFPGPNAALLWYFFRCSWTVFANGAFLLFLALFITYFSEELEYVSYFLIPSVAIMAFAAASILTGASYPFGWRTPVRTAALVHTELLIVLFIVLWMLALFGLSSLFIDPIPVTFYIGSVPAALFVYGIARTSNIDHRVGLARLFSVAGIVALLILVFTSSPVPTPGTLIFWRPLWLAFAVTAALAVMYWAVRRHAQHTRHGFARRMLSPAQGGAAARRHSLPQRVPAQRPPFMSQNAAQEWREWRELANRFRSLGELSFSTAYLAFLPLFLRLEPLSSQTLFADYFLGVTLYIGLHLSGWQPPVTTPPVPLTDWNYSVVLLRVLGIVIAVGAVALWLPRLLLLFDPEARALAILAPQMMLAAAWVGWISVALGQGLVFGLIAIGVLHSTHGNVYDSLLAPFGLTGLLLPILLQAKPIARASRAALPVALAGIAFAGAGMFVLPTLDIPPPYPILLREILGAALVLGLLYPLIVMKVIPARMARAICALLAAGVLAIALVTSTIGPISAPGPGILSTYMEFGILAPLLLPVVMMPHFLRLREMVKDRWW